MQRQDSSSGQVAVIQEAHNGLEAVGAFNRFKLPFKGTATPGDLFLVKGGKQATPIRRLGRPDSIQTVIEAMLLDAGEYHITQAEEQEAERVTGAGESFARRDLTHLATFTIDGESTRDFDDAISAKAEGENIRIFVHVADVSAYIRPGSLLDQAARRRGNSIYLPTQTILMLPRALSNGVCSLVPHQERAAVTCEILLHHGTVMEKTFYRSRIKSIARLTYDHVDQIFLGRIEPGPTYSLALQAAREAAHERLGSGVDKGGDVQFDIDQGQVIGLRDRTGGESHHLIERLMLLANAEVAGFLQKHQAPTLYRTHQITNRERETALIKRLASLGLAGVRDLAHAYELVQQAENEKYLPLLQAARLGAEYTPTMDGHQGLELGAYLHFTSPIRRYADLVVHRSLLAEIGEDTLEATPRLEGLNELGEHLGERGRITRKLERRAGSACRVSYLCHRLQSGAPHTRDGRIAGMSPAGCFIDIGETEGLLPARALGGGPNEELTIWKGSRTLSIGDVLPVKIKSLDPVKGQVLLDTVSNKRAA